jgi:hypothetical protein
MYPMQNQNRNKQAGKLFGGENGGQILHIVGNVPLQIHLGIKWTGNQPVIAYRVGGNARLPRHHRIEGARQPRKLSGDAVVGMLHSRKHAALAIVED